MSEVRHEPYQQLSSHMADEVVMRIKELEDDKDSRPFFYSRMSQVIEGALFEAVHIGLSTAGTMNPQGPAELMEAFNAGITQGKKDQEE